MTGTTAIVFKHFNTLDRVIGAITFPLFFFIALGIFRSNWGMGIILAVGFPLSYYWLTYRQSKTRSKFENLQKRIREKNNL